MAPCPPPPALLSKTPRQGQISSLQPLWCSKADELEHTCWRNDSGLIKECVAHLAKTTYWLMLCVYLSFWLQSTSTQQQASCVVHSKDVFCIGSATGMISASSDRGIFLLCTNAAAHPGLQVLESYCSKSSASPGVEQRFCLWVEDFAKIQHVNFIVSPQIVNSLAHSAIANPQSRKFRRCQSTNRTSSFFL